MALLIPDMKKKILDVGQCPPDHASLKALAEKAGAEVTKVALPREAMDLMKTEKFDLVFVNRKIDADYTDGLELIKMMQQNEHTKNTPVMLISNYGDAQAEAVSHGAIPGFGKNDIGTQPALDRVMNALNAVV